MVKKLNRQTKSPSVQEDPAWLLADSEGEAPPPPLQPRAALLPFNDLEWRDFERLCRRLAQCSGTVENAWSYGTIGQRQFGIDILVRLNDGTYEVWQTKRYRKFTAPYVSAAIKLFLKHKWAKVANKFVLVVACNLDSTAVVEAIDTGGQKLKAKSITFRTLDQSQLTELLRNEPILVDDYFSRPWAQAICPPEAMEILARRISRPDYKVLRKSLRDCYSSWISTVDPGMPIAGLDRLGRTLAAVPISKRYVEPDVLLPSITLDRGEQKSEIESTRNSANDSDRDSRANNDEHTSDRIYRSALPIKRENRVTIDKFLGSYDRAIIEGDAGLGKSTLLRMLALDILSNTPKFTSVRERYANFVPVWVSFALWVRMATEQSSPPPLGDVVAQFFKAQNRPDLGTEVGKSLAGSRIILLVDGLDEASDPTAARTVAAVLSAFVEDRGIPVLVTTRPHGVRAIGTFSATWVRAELAPLSDTQRHTLVKLWYRVLKEIESEVKLDSRWLNEHTERQASIFTSDLKRNPGIARLSSTPLFLLALMELHRHGKQMPRSRFAAIEKIVEQLVEHQPQRRATDALLTRGPTINLQLRDRLMADFAFALQMGQLQGSVPDSALEETAIDRASGITFERLGTNNIEEAESSARELFKFAEERAGLLVKKAPRNIGFLHLSIQEFLAGRHLVQFSLSKKIAFVQEHAGQARWREPILYLLYLVQSESDVGELIRAIERTPIADHSSVIVRETLLTEAVFADLAHDINVVRGIAGRLLSEVRLSHWGTQQRHLLSGTVDGLLSEAVRNLCRTEISAWDPDRHGYGRAAAIRTMGLWPPSSRSNCFKVLMHSLAADEQTTRLAAARALASFAADGIDVKGELLKLLRTAPSVETLVATLQSLGEGWALDADIGEIAAIERSNPNSSIALESIRILAKRNQTESKDFKRFFVENNSRREMLYRNENRDLVEHFANSQRSDYIKRLHEEIDKTSYGEHHNLMHLIGALVICDPTDPYVARGILELFKTEWAIRELFERSEFPADRILWTSDQIAEIERFTRSSKKYSIDYELYWISKVIRLDVVKEKLLSVLQKTGSFRFWAADALAEFWGADDEQVRTAFLSFLDADSEEIAMVANALSIVMQDKRACRAIVLKALREGPQRVDFLFRALQRLGVSNDDQDAFEAALEARKGLVAPAYDVHWRTGMILTFPRQPRVRELALEEITRRDGAIGAVARSYADDTEMTSKVLGVLDPMPRGARESLALALQTIGSTDDFSLNQLYAMRQDTEREVSSEATIGWVEALVARDAFGPQHVEDLVAELDAVGPDYDSRRAAAVVGLAISGHLERFEKATENKGEPMSVDASGSFGRDGDRFLRRLIPRWKELVRVLGSEEKVMKRLNITPDRTLSQIDPSWPNAQHVFAVVMQQVPLSAHLSQHIPMLAMARFTPTSSEMRELIRPVLVGGLSPSKDVGYWTGLIAGEIFADHFRSDVELRSEVTEQFLREPQGYAAGALAELVLRQDEPELQRVLGEKTVGLRYDIATHFRLVAATSKPETVIKSLVHLLNNDLQDTGELQFSRWVPAILRRIERDSAVRDLLNCELTPEAPPSVKASFASLLRQAAGADERLRTFISRELERTVSERMANVGFDLSSQSYRIVRHVLLDLIE